MIIFDLGCPDDHRFEGWFRSTEEFSAQQDRGLVACPHCGSTDIRRLPSAVYLAASAPAAAAAAPAVQAMPSPAALARAVVDHLVSQSEDVGSEFAAEARRIHYHEAPERSIRGQASADDYAALQDEGIDVIRLPKIKSEDLN